MDLTTAATVATAICAVIAILVAFLQWHRGEDLRRQLEKYSSLESRVDDVEKHIEHCESNAQALRDEIHKEYVRVSELREIRDAQHQDVQNIFAKLNGLSKAVNQVIGYLDADRRFHGQQPLRPMAEEDIPA